ncbi:MAG: sulfite exporter TauE/SafE family protein [Halonotius sp.]
MRWRRLGSVLAATMLAAVLLATPVAADGTLLQGTFTFRTEQFFTHWWIFPASILFSTVALASGVSGALFFTPFFLLGVGLTPAQAVGAGLLTELFGMGNGLRSYVKQDVVDYATAKYLLVGAVPAVVVGAFAAHYIEPRLLKFAFGAGLVLLGGFLLYYDPPEDCEPGSCEGGFLKRKNSGRGTTTIEAADGEAFTYDTCWRPPGVALSTAGGFITGLISAGLPEIVTTQLIVRCRLPPRVAVATSVFVLAIAAAAGAAVHALAATPVWFVVAWSIPGVVVGGTIGTRVGKYVPSDLMETGLGVVFAIVGGIVLATELLV